MKEIPISPKTKALIFDIDGTLADTMGLHYKAWQIIAREMGWEYPEETFYELAGIPTPKIVKILNERFNLTMNAEEIVPRKEKAFLKVLPQVEVIKPVVDLVYQYHNKLPMALGTGGRRGIATKTIEAIGLSDYFEIMVAAEDVENHKPAPDTFLKCAEAMNVEPQFCQVFEDALQGLTAGKNAGMIVTDITKYL